MAAAPLPLSAFSTRCDTTWRVPGSKSITNRALVLAALAEGTSIIENVLVSDDTRHMRNALTAMGVSIRDGAADQLIINGGRSQLHAVDQDIFIGNSGTTVRFLSALAALIPGASTFVGDAHMAKRPIADLVDGLTQVGVRITCPSGCPPLTVHGGPIPSGSLRMRGDRSSQYFSAVLMALSLADGPITVHIDGTLVSRPYVAMTLRMIADFGGRVDETDDGFLIHAIPSYRARTYTIEPDASSASYPFACAAVGGHRIIVPALTASSLQGDYGFVTILERMGAHVERLAHATIVEGRQPLRGIDVDMHHISDTVMTLAAIAPLCIGPTTIRNIANIRIKETDRLMATVQELRRIGQIVEHGDDWLRITPQPLRPATISCYSDHRMAMSFAILAVNAHERFWDSDVARSERRLIIEDPDCTAKTYPHFWSDLQRLTADAARHSPPA